MVQFINLPVEEKLGASEGVNQEDGRQDNKSPLDPTNKDFDFSLWSKAVKQRMNKVLQKRQF